MVAKKREMNDNFENYCIACQSYIVTRISLMQFCNFSKGKMKTNYTPCLCIHLSIYIY